MNKRHLENARVMIEDRMTDKSTLRYEGVLVVGAWDGGVWNKQTLEDIDVLPKGRITRFDLIYSTFEGYEFKVKIEP